MEMMERPGRSFLLIKQSSLGDVIHTLPVVHALKRCQPRCRIGWVVEQGFAPLVAADPAVDEVYPIHIPSTSSPGAGRTAYVRAGIALFRTMRRLRAAFRAAPYEVVLDLHASFRSGVLSLMNPGGVRIGFSGARELNPLFQHQLVERGEEDEHAVEQNLRFCRFLGCTPAAEDFYLAVASEDAERVKRFLEESGIGRDDPVVYANPTARWESKFWPAKRWSELADRLATRGRRVIFGGAPDDLPYIETITAGMRTPATVAAGRLRLTESAALIQRSAVYVGLDTGPMHIAAMAGTPVVALFGPTHPERVGPYGVRSRVMQAEGLPCLRCRKRSCERMDCMRGISVARVESAVEELSQEVGQSGQ
ncbi:MAG: glycosyltransferase family 9 protein [Desulfobulbus sp.]|jgi:heptosyltransferase-1